MAERGRIRDVAHTDIRIQAMASVSHPLCNAAISRRHWLAGVILTILLTSVAPLLRADTLTVAVASNFAETLEALVSEFERHSPHRITLVRGSSGRHYAQIINGAPFDLFFSADSERPEALRQALNLPSGRVRSYALGRLVLIGANSQPDAVLRERLKGNEFNVLAIANPRLAPYGQAAVETLQALGLWAALEKQPGRLVRGENVAQAYQFVATGNADLGFVALSQVLGTDIAAYWLIPDEFYAPIDQQLVILRDSEASLALVDFLTGEAASSIIAEAGYALPDIRRQSH